MANLTLLCVNSIIFTVSSNVGDSRGGKLCGWPMAHIMSGLNPALQLQNHIGVNFEVYDNMQVWEGSNMRIKVVILILVWCY